MKTIHLSNTRTKKKEKFIPVIENKVGLYCCGPTVYHYAHIGNMRTYIFEDLLVKMFRYFKYDVKHVMNITDVGHLSSDADEGEDKLEIGAKREGKSVWEVAKQYTDAFFMHADKLNIQKPTITCNATEHIKQQIEMIRALEQKGHTYISQGNVFFDVSTYPQYANFAKLQLDQQQKHRVDTHQGKKQPQDFALWFTRSKFENHAMQWESPWGSGYPGWHIECSAMAYYYLKDQLDIHCGGVDHINVHHTNEIAQSECATGKKFFNYWMHGEFLIDETGKMSKSKGEFLTVTLLEEKGYDPLAYRYLCLQTHYKKQLTFSWKSLESAHQSLQKLRQKAYDLQKNKTNILEIESQFKDEFEDAIADDLNIPKALGILHTMFDSNLTEAEKFAHIQIFDSVFGLGLLDWKPNDVEVPEDIQKLVDERQIAREQKDWKKSDELRNEIEKLGFIVKDTKDGSVLEKTY